MNVSDSILMTKLTDYERLTNINRFIFATPFCPGGGARGGITEQHNRKTIITAERCFPFVKTRIPIAKDLTREIVLTPIEVAAEDIAEKAENLASAIHNKKYTLIQLNMGGIVATTVNAGPLHVAVTFLRLIGPLVL